jgi:hypothetical protein
MALLAEEIVEEWLNRSGWFTIRGIKLGVDEIDILAIKPDGAGVKCRHIEVQASFNPIGYVTKVPKSMQTEGRKAGSVKERTEAELKQSVAEWVKQKFNRPKKANLRRLVHPGPWSRELVVHNVRHPEELELIRKAGVTVHRLTEVVNQLRQRSSKQVKAAAADLVDLVTGFSPTTQNVQ